MSSEVELLANSPLFARLPTAHLQQIATRLTRVDLPPGSVLVRQGDTADAMYFLESGSLSITVHDATTGLTYVVAHVEAPETVGELALLTGQPRTGTLTAVVPSVVYRLSYEVFTAVLQQVPQVALGLARALAEKVSDLNTKREIPWRSLAGVQRDPRLWSLVPEGLLRQTRMVPIEVQGRTLTVGMVDPRDTGAIDALRRALPNLAVRIVAVNGEEAARLLDRGIAAGPSLAPAASGPAGSTVRRPQGPIPNVTYLEELGPNTGPGGSQVVSALTDVIAQSLALGASDIHIEQDRKGVSVRARVDGALTPVSGGSLPGDLGKPMVSRIKVLARLDVTDTRKPQDGRISIRANDRMVDLRVSTLPVKFGEKVVLRILDSELSISDLKSLMHVDQMQTTYRQMVYRPQGLLMVTGPTGSGKTTTLYSSLNLRRKPEVNIITVEDPIEYHMDGVTQVQVFPEQGLTFATALRAILRQDPNVILVGEMRDAEAAHVAVEASMTGHFVMTSVHTNGALEAIVRLSDLGIQPYQISSSLVGILHQRLVRRVCAGCAQPFEYPPQVLELLVQAGALAAGDRPQMVRGAGCNQCGGTGFKGRVGIYELLVMNDALRNAIANRADLQSIQQIASHGAMMSLNRYAGLLVAQGLTVPGEVLPVLSRPIA